LWLLEINGESEKHGAQVHASEHLTRNAEARKRQCEDTMGVLTAAETGLVQFVIRRCGGFVNSQIHIIKNLIPAGWT
jgi:hypothetical protein